MGVRDPLRDLIREYVAVVVVEGVPWREHELERVGVGSRDS